MEISALYTVEFPESVLIFTESATGTFDYDGALDPQTAGIRMRELLGREAEPTELVFPDEWGRRPLYRRADANAVAVMVRDRSGRTGHAGYLKREVAALFSRFSSSPSNLQARFFHVTERGADIEVWAR